MNRNQMNRDLFYTIKAMRIYGGSFVQALAGCLQHADDVNTEKIIATWPQYLDQYEKMGIELQKMENHR